MRIQSGLATVVVRPDARITLLDLRRYFYLRF